MREISRRQVAREEIETSIDLILNEGSLVVAHLAAWAAIDVLRGVATARGKNTFFERMEEHIRPEKIKFWRKIIRSHYTFAKHSDRDPERIVTDFNPESTHLVILATIIDYGEIYRQLTTPMYMFRAWMLARTPDLLVEGAREEIIPGIEKVFGRNASLNALQELYREFKRDETYYKSQIPEERKTNIEV